MYMYKYLPSEGCWRLAMRYGYGYDQEPDTMELIGVFSFFFFFFQESLKKKMNEWMNVCIDLFVAFLLACVRR